MRPLLMIVPLALFVLWIFYRLLIKRDLKKHLDTLYPGLFFLSTWLVIYWFLLH